MSAETQPFSLRLTTDQLFRTPYLIAPGVALSSRFIDTDEELRGKAYSVGKVTYWGEGSGEVVIGVRSPAFVQPSEQTGIQPVISEIAVLYQDARPVTISERQKSGFTISKTISYNEKGQLIGVACRKTNPQRSELDEAQATSVFYLADGMVIYNVRQHLPTGKLFNQGVFLPAETVAVLRALKAEQPLPLIGVTELFGMHSLVDFPVSSEVQSQLSALGNQEETEIKNPEFVTLVYGSATDTNALHLQIDTHDLLAKEATHS